MPSVRIPTPLRRLTGEKDEVTVNSKNIGELINELHNKNAFTKKFYKRTN